MIAGLNLCLVLQASGVRFVLDEPKAALTILGHLQKQEAVSDKDWNLLFASEGYRRLKARESGMKRPFTDDSFKAFLQKPETIAKTDDLAKNLDAMAMIDIQSAAQRPLAYLPAGTKLRATVYPLIKPLHNSFVWDVEKNPAIMLYMDPAKSANEVFVTAAHELHHVGYSASCPSPEFNTWQKRQSEPVKKVLYWAQAFGEGYAVLCQTGGPNPNPYSMFDQETSDAWVSHYAGVSDDFRKVQTFFSEILSGKLAGDSADKQAFEFYGLLGPWYTVGYLMGSTIEEAFGRDKLIACYRDPRLVFVTYNEAALMLNLQDKKDRPLWNQELLSSILGRSKI